MISIKYFNKKSLGVPLFMGDIVTVNNVRFDCIMLHGKNNFLTK